MALVPDAQGNSEEQAGPRRSGTAIALMDATTAAGLEAPRSPWHRMHCHPPVKWAPPMSPILSMKGWHNWSSLFGKRGRRKRRGRQAVPRRQRPEIEKLEDRCLLTTV